MGPLLPDVCDSLRDRKLNMKFEIMEVRSSQDGNLVRVKEVITNSWWRRLFGSPETETKEDWYHTDYGIIWTKMSNLECQTPVRNHTLRVTYNVYLNNK